jgi:dihydrofolate synthase/folylpolyglutamate synthase
LRLADPHDPVARFGQVRRELEGRWPESRLEPTLTRIANLTSLLGDPQRAFPVIHVTGTNGKTSTARQVESLLRSFGLHTGLMTSPHLNDLRERIQLDGEPIEIERFLAVVEEVTPVLELADSASVAAGGPELSFFEVITALGFAAFADAPVDVAVVEVGMGGTWDATNVADGTVAVITPIGLDHSEYLGDTLPLIAAEKAGIIKPGSIVVMAEQPVEVAEIIAARAHEARARLLVAGIDFGIAGREMAVGGQMLTLSGVAGTYADVFLPLFGAHQAGNAALALAAVEAFFGAGDLGSDPATGGAELRSVSGGRSLDATMVTAGFAQASSPGRLEVVRRGPTVIVDAAHNRHGMNALASAVGESFAFAHLVGVFGALAGKDACGMAMELEPLVDAIVVTRSTSSRAIPVPELVEVVTSVFGEGRVHQAERLDDALDLAVALAELGAPAGVGGGVLVTGSVTVAGEARLLLGAESGAEEGRSNPDHGAPRGLDPEHVEMGHDSEDSALAWEDES